MMHDFFSLGSGIYKKYVLLLKCEKPRSGLSSDFILRRSAV